MSDILKGRISPNKGITMSEEQKIKYLNLLKGRNFQKSIKIIYLKPLRARRNLKRLLYETYTYSF